MRILLGQNSQYYPAYGGGDRSNRLLMEALAGRGHQCFVVARAADRFSDEIHARYLDTLGRDGIEAQERDGGVEFVLRGVRAFVVTRRSDFRGCFAEELERLDPDVVVLSTDDPALLLLEVALRHPRCRIIFLARTTLALPFGPEAAFPSEAKTGLLRQVDAVVGVSRYVAGYIRDWSGIQAVAVPISLLEPGPYPELGSFHNEFVTMVNPCAVKGISIFLALADRLPEVQFAAVPTWGTTQQDLAELRRRPNVEILPPADHIDEIFRRTRILLVPSLWAEARSRIVVEAMLRGVPVLASNVGGIPEAKMGVDYLLPVNPIRRYRPVVDDRMVPVAEVPPQDVEPWLAALRELLEDPARYEQLARESRRVALQYAEGLSIRPFEELLEQCLAKPPARFRSAPARPVPLGSRIESLSPEKRALLQLRLQKRPASASPMACADLTELWFPGAQSVPPEHLRLFCFPYAGGGTAFFRRWQPYLPAGVSVCPARLPGRESRAAETPIASIDEMIAALVQAFRPLAHGRFAFFGHSMGAILAFELCRWLSRQRLTGPVALFVAAARAPQLRRGPVGGPTVNEEELVEELKQLGGLPESVLAHSQLLEYVLPALRADSELGRRYVYQPGPPLEIPIYAYTGERDPRLSPEVVRAWSEQTRCTFRLRVLPGGHFFLHEHQEDFLQALAGDLAELVRTPSR